MKRPLAPLAHLARLAVVALFAAPLSASCGPPPTPPPVAATSDLVVPPIGVKSENAPGAAGAGGGAAETCKARLTVGGVKKSSATCYLDQKLEGKGELSYPCTGDGAAEARFGALRYTGAVAHGALTLEARTEIDWDGDGCRWGTTGTIEGRVPTGTGKGQKLEWRYEDYVVRGTSCSGACTASASLSVQE